MTDFQTILKQNNLPICNILQEIADKNNISESFDYVVSHLESKDQRENIKPKKAAYCKMLHKLLSTGEFRITENDFRELRVIDGPKERIVQCPRVFHRIGCHAVMVPVERHTYPTLIKNTAASIKGRGMHWLHDIIEEDLLADPDGMKYYYQSDIYHYYDSISQQTMKDQVREYITDENVLPMLDNFISLLSEGLSKGLRSSQCFANLHLNKIDHRMCDVVDFHEVKDGGTVIIGIGKVIIDGMEIRFHYYRYCDDIVIIDSSKKDLWKLRNYLIELLKELNLTIKSTEAIRPITEGLDYLGYVTFVDDTKHDRVVYSRIRKRTKVKFAKRIKRVKSRKRRQSLIGSFFGMAAHADCRNLLKKLITQNEYKKLKHKRKMKDFSEFKITPTTLNGKKNFKGQKVSMQELDRKGIIVVDFERDVIPRRESDDYTRRLQSASAQGIDPELVAKPKKKYIISLICENQLRKLWTGDKEIWQILDQIEEADGMPFFVGIEVDYSGNNKKFNFVPASKLGLKAPTDAELETLLIKYNLQHLIKK